MKEWRNEEILVAGYHGRTCKVFPAEETVRWFLSCNFRKRNRWRCMKCERITSPQDTVNLIICTFWVGSVSLRGALFMIAAIFPATAILHSSFLIQLRIANDSLHSPLLTPHSLQLTTDFGLPTTDCRLLVSAQYEFSFTSWLFKKKWYNICVLKRALYRRLV